MIAPIDRTDRVAVRAAVGTHGRRIVDSIHRGDTCAFSAFVMRDNHGAELDIAPIHVTLVNFVRWCWANGHYAGILAPWRHGKTLIVIEALGLHEIGQNTNTRIRLVAAIDDEAMKRVGAMRRYVTLNPEYHRVYPNVTPAEKSEWNLHKFYVRRESLNQDPTLSAAGVEANEAGGGYDIVMFDDVASRRNMIDQDEKRLQVFEQMTSVWLQRIDPGTRVVYAGTRWHADDPPGLFLAKGDTRWRWLVVGVAEDFKKLVCAVGSTEAETQYDEHAVPLTKAPTTFASDMKFALPLWEQRPEQWLRARAQDRWAFSRGYRQRAPRAEDRLFSNLSKFLLYGITVDQLVAKTAERFSGYDPAGSSRKGNALVTAAWGTLPSGAQTRVLTRMDLWRGSGEESATRIATAYMNEHWAGIAIEVNGLQEDRMTLIDDAIPGIPLIPHVTTGSNKRDAFDFGGAESLELQVRTGSWVLCMDDPYDTGAPLSQHDAACGCPYHQFISELNNFTPGRKDDYYDLLMAWWFCGTAMTGKLHADVHQRAVEQDELGDEGVIPADEIGGVLALLR